MSKLSFLDKLRILVEVSQSSKLYILVLVLLVALVAFFSTTNRKNVKRNKIIYILVTIFIMILIVATYHAPLGNMFGYMMDNFFIAAFFPNLAIYFAALVAMNIILWISLFNYRTSNSIKTLNLAVYVIMNYLLALILNIINSNKLDIFEQSSVYGNKQATALIELSSLVFIIWILFLIIYKIILVYLRKDFAPRTKKVLVKRTIRKLPDNYEPTNIPNFVHIKKETFNKQEEVPEIIGIKDIIPEETIQTIGIKDIIPEEENNKYTSNNNQSLIGNLLIDDEEEEDFVPLLDTKKEEIDTKPVMYEEPIIIESHDVDPDEELRQSIEKLLTLDDYKLLLRMLKEQKEKDRQKEIENTEQEKLREEQIKLQEEQEKLRKEKEKIEIKKKEKEDKRYNELLELYKVN